MNQQEHAQSITDQFAIMFQGLCVAKNELDTIIESAETFIAYDKVNSADQVQTLRGLKKARADVQSSLTTLLVTRDLGFAVFAERGTPSECPCIQPTAVVNG